MSNKARQPSSKPVREIIETFELSKPIKAWGKEVTLLEFREPTLGDYEEVESFGDIGKVRRLIELLAALPADAAKKISGQDFIGLGEVMAGFLAGNPTDGDEEPQS